MDVYLKSLSHKHADRKYTVHILERLFYLIIVVFFHFHLYTLIKFNFCVLYNFTHTQPPPFFLGRRLAYCLADVSLSFN